LKYSFEERFAERLSKHEGLWSRIQDSEPEGRILGCGPVRNFVREPVGAGWALVGDPGMHQDPWTGLGMDMAAIHAVDLAESIRKSLRGEVSEGVALESYQRYRNDSGLPDYRETVTLARDLGRAAIC
jgi:flavin-dependent dehydrogenase